MTCRRIPVSVVVPARNEALNLPDCLRSVEWADEVFVVDSHSTDATGAIAAAHGAQLVNFDYAGGWPKKKNWALRNLPFRNDWVLILDADERVTPELMDAIAMAITRPEVDGYYLRWKFIFLGRWMRHAWSHGWMLRLLRRGAGEYEDLGMRGEGGWDNEVHENIVVRGRTGRLQPHLLHDSEQTLSYWIRKQNEFSDWNAIRRLRQLREPLPPWRDLWSRDPLRRRKILKAAFLRLPAKPILLFLHLYIVRRGFLDGRAGLYFCALRAAHELHTCAKLMEAESSQQQNSG